MAGYLALEGHISYNNQDTAKYSVCIFLALLLEPSNIKKLNQYDSCEFTDIASFFSHKPKSPSSSFYISGHSSVLDLFLRLIQFRLEKGSTLLDLRLECQELERFSILNHLGKFHGRTHANGVVFFPKRNITPLPVPGNLPEGVLCLSL